MKVTDKMVLAAHKAIGSYPEPYDSPSIDAVRAGVEAAIAAYVPLTKSQAAKARWAATPVDKRRKSMDAARKKLAEMKPHW